MKLMTQRIVLSTLFGLLWLAPLSGRAADAIKNEVTTSSPPVAADQFASEQAEAINKVPGVNVTAEDLKQQPKKHLDLNPVDWLFAPVIKMEKQSVLLEQDIMKLTGPIASLQPGMLGLEKSITSVQGQMGTVDTKLGNVQRQMHGLQQDVRAMRMEIGEIKRPVIELKQPIMDIEKPISTMGAHLSGLDQELKDLKTLISMVLTSIFIAAVLIAIGTPLAAILIWRNRAKLLPAAKPHEAADEASIENAGRTMTGQLRR